MAGMPDPLPIAALAFTAGDDVRANADAIRAAIAQAADQGARVLLTPECGLTGYPTEGREDVAGIDWTRVAACEDELARLARSRGILLVLGTIAPRLARDARQPGGASGAPPTCANVALCCGAMERTSYVKQCLTPTDRGFFHAGDQACVVEFAGWRLGIAICYDLRFPDVWLALAEGGADAFLVLAHMAGPDPDPGTKSAVIPALCATRAAETATPLALCNTAAADRYLDSGCWDARGVRIVGRGAGLMTATLIHRNALDPWYGGLRATALERWKSR